MQKARQTGTELLIALVWACTLMLIIRPAVLFLLQVLSAHHAQRRRCGCLAETPGTSFSAAVRASASTACFLFQTARVLPSIRSMPVYNRPATVITA